MARLIETEWPQFGPAAEAPAFTVQEFSARVQRLRIAMEARGLEVLVVYGDREHFANLAYLTNFDPRFEEALLIVGREGNPLLLVGNECEAYLPISPLWKAALLRKEVYQPFSLLDQPRANSRLLREIFSSEGIGSGTKVGCVGFKYYGDPHSIDLPSYIVDALRGLAGFENVTDETDLLMHPGYGLRANCTPYEIALFEYSNVKASEAMRRVHFALRCGITDHELLAEARYDGTPLACHMTLKTGPKRISLASPSGAVLERGHTWSANISYWGSNICRAGWVADSAADLPAPARDYVDVFAGPYFDAMAEWLGAMRIGTQGGVLNDLIATRLPFEKFNIFLNPGHLIHLDEWLSSPIYAGSEIRIASGMVFQTDVIPSNNVYFSTRMEDGIAIADASLRADIAQIYPATMERCQERKRFVEETLGIGVPDEVLLLSNMACLVPPYLLRPNLVFAR